MSTETEEKEEPKAASMAQDVNMRVWTFQWDKEYKEIGIDMDEGPTMNEKGEWCIDVIFRGAVHQYSIYADV